MSTFRTQRVHYHKLSMFALRLWGALHKYVALTIAKSSLTVDGDKGGGRGPLLGHVASHTAVVGAVLQPGLQDQEAAVGAHDEVGLLGRVQLDSIPQPSQNIGLGLSSGWMTDQLALFANLYLAGVGRCLEISLQI